MDEALTPNAPAVPDAPTVPDAPAAPAAQPTPPLFYKGHPLLRKENTLYYGSMNDPFIIELHVLETKTVKDLEIATKVSIMLEATDPDVKPKDRIIKKSEKSSLYSAMDIASIWLDRALNK